MKRKFTFLIAAAFMLLTMMASTATAWGQTRETAGFSLKTTSTVPIAANSNPATGTINGTGSTWDVTITGTFTSSSMQGTSGNKYWQMGKKDAPITSAEFSTDDISGTITNIVVNCAAYSGIGTISATVGGNAFGTQNQNIPTWASNAGGNVTFAGTGATGNIVVTMTAGDGARAMYIQSITVTYSTGGGSDPSITASDVNLAYDATQGSITYTVNNPVTGGEMSSSPVSGGDWLTVGGPNNGSVPLSCETNTATTARTATVRLTYSYGTSKETVTKDVTVTQAAAPIVCTTIPELFSAATSVGNTATSATITLNNWVVSGVSVNGKNVFVTDGINGFVIFDNGGSMGFATGNILSGTVSCKVQLYNGFAEITQLNSQTSGISITTGGTVTAAEIEMADLAGVNTGALVHYDNLTCNVTTSGEYTNYDLTDGTTTIRAYKTLYNYTSTPDLEDGKTYNITGVYQQYNSTKEILPRSADDIEEVIPTDPTITVTPSTVNASAAGEDGTLTVTYTNITTVVADIYFCDSEGAEASYTWIDAEINNDDNVYYVIEANDGAARTAYLKVWAYADDATTKVYSDIVTINQAAYVVDYATLPFEWEGGLPTAFEELNGTTLYSVDSYPNQTTYQMKLDSDGDYIQVKTNEQPGVVTVGVKMVGGNTTSTLTVQGSADGETFTNIEALTISGKQNDILNLETTNDFAATDRYVRLLFTKGSNVGVGPITIAQVDNTPSITISPGPYNLNCDGGDAELPVTYTNMPTDPQAEVIFYESNGETPLTENPTWITATINANYNIAGHLDVNTGDARSAYFKVKGIDADNNDVYSDLVTINQAAYVLSIVFETTELDIEVGGEQNRVLSFEYQGFGQNPAFEVRQYDATGQTQTTYEWLTTNITQGHKVNITVDANTGAARSGYFKVYGSDGTVNTESNLVTINQAEYVALTYTVTYNANGGTGTMTDPNSPYTENTEVTLLENTFGAPEGKIWDSWLVKDANQTTIEVNEGKFNMPASNVTVTAQWIDNPIVPTYEWVLTALEDLTSSDVFVIVGNNGSTYAMTNDNGIGSAPATSSVTIANNKLSDAPADNLKWNVEVTTNGYTFYPNGITNKWLYCTDTNNGLRVGTGEKKVFGYEEVTTTNKEGYYLTITPASDKRYVCIYNSADWRSYKSGSIVKTDTKFYKRQEASTDPQLYTDDVNIESDATEGAITYTLENPVSGGELTAEITDGNEGNWLTLGTIGENIPFTCSANTEATARTATVTLTYTYNAKTSITATAVVTQAALIIDYATLPFAYDGNGTGELPTGLTPTGLGTYNQSPAMKFDGTGDNLILKLNHAPVSLSYDIKGNGFSEGTFTVQTSADGDNYEDLVTYTTLGEVQSITHLDLDASVRYIKWIYTNKKTGNVALGNIHATEHYDTYGDVTFSDLDLTTSSQSLIIHDGSVVTVTGTLTNNSPDNLVIKDGGQLYHNNSVAASMEKTIEGVTNWHNENDHGGGWYLLSSPIGMQSAYGLETVVNLAPEAVAGVPQFDLFTYNEPNVQWMNFNHNSYAVYKGQGFLYARHEGATLKFSGTLPVANTELSPSSNPKLEYTEANGDMAGWNLIGNPYSHNITWANLSVSDINTAGYYRMVDGAWITEASKTAEIKPMEGFLVKAIDNNPYVMIQNTSSSKDNTDNDFVEFIVNSANHYDVTYAMFSEGEGLEKISHRNTDIPMVYIPKDGERYAIATIGDNTEAFNLNFKAMTTGQYTLKMKANSEYSYLHVIDRLTGEDVDMLLNGEYTFIGSPRDDENRFIVRLNANSNFGADNDIFAYQNGSEIIVSGEGELQIFDVMGRFVMSRTINGNGSINTATFNTGVYVLRMVGETVKTQKIVVK